MNRKSLSLFPLILIGFGGMTGAETLAQSRDNYGAIATSDSSSDAWGYGFDYPTRAQAERRALEECGRSDCQVRVWFKNACGSVATNGSRIGWAWASTRAEAEAQAMSACSQGDCRVQVWVCTTRQ